MNRRSPYLTAPSTDPHPDANLEWWYVYAFLQGIRGRPYAVMASFFRVGEAKCLTGHYLIDSIVRLDEKRFTPRSMLDTRLKAQLIAFYLPYTLILQPSDKKLWKLFGTLLTGRLPYPHEPMEHASVRAGPADLQYGQARFSFDPDGEGAFTVRLARKESSADLTFTPAKPISAIDESGTLNGLSYYSCTRNRVEGRLLIEGRSEEVTGEGWFDHQWGRNSDLLKGIGWNWFGLLLDDGRELLISQKRPGQPEADAAAKAFLIDRDHSLHSTGQVTLEPLRYWKSMYTETRYPVQWLISIPDFSMRLKVEPLLNKQEMPVIGPLQAIWEGAVRVSGEEITYAGSRMKVAGKGFMELVGYAGP